ncbi:MAG TPA: glycosyltransferase family 39 protein [Ktedonobacterales bacterium]
MQRRVSGVVGDLFPWRRARRYLSTEQLIHSIISLWLAAVAVPVALREARVALRPYRLRTGEWLVEHGLRRTEALVTIVATLLSVVSFGWYASQGLVLAYGDAISHMSIAHRVFSSRTPGLAQLGSVWPPLDHIFMLPFVWNTTLYRSGLGGALPSMIAYVIAVLYTYRTGALVFGSRTSGLVAASAIMLNPSILYMQATPMSEMDLICFATVAVFYASRWSRTLQAPDLTKCAAAVAAGTLIRYDGWALALALLVILTAIAWIKRGRLFAESTALLYGMLAFAGCAAWLIYEQVIFGSAFDFFNGPYSAKSQEHSIQVAGGLLTYHNLLLSLHVYTQVVVDAAGLPLVVAALVGLGWWAWSTRRNVTAWPLYAVLVPFAFNWLSLVMGVTTIVTPEVPNGGSATYFNVRYGMMMLPAVALFVAALATSKRPLLPAVATLIVLFAGGTFLTGTPYALQDPLHGANALGKQEQTAEARWLDAHYHGGAILASGGAFTPMMFYTNLPSKDFITENDGALFQSTVNSPQTNVEWVLVDPHNNNFDAVWSALREKTTWKHDYALRATFGSVQVFQRIDASPRLPSKSTTASSAPLSPMYRARFAYVAHFSMKRPKRWMLLPQSLTNQALVAPRPQAVHASHSA